MLLILSNRICFWQIQNNDEYSVFLEKVHEIAVGDAIVFQNMENGERIERRIASVADAGNTNKVLLKKSGPN